MKRLGQHFLKNRSAIQKIVTALDLKKGDTVIEIGPGRGALTFPLLEACKSNNCRLIAIEKDKILAQGLSGEDGFEIITGDALKELQKVACAVRSREGSQRIASNGVDNLRNKAFKVTGNIPYYITGKLLRVLGKLKNKPKMTVLTIQKEVAERVSASPPKMNLLAAAVQVWADPRVLLSLKESDFQPPPKVKSAVILLKTKPKQLTTKESDKYYTIIKALFRQPRKTLLNNLASGLKLGKQDALNLLSSIDFHEKSRPQELSLENIVTLTKKIKLGIK